MVGHIWAEWRLGHGRFIIQQNWKAKARVLGAFYEARAAPLQGDLKE